MTRLLFHLILALVLPLTGLATRASAQDIVLYTSIDQPFFAPIVQKFEAETGLKVRVLTDAEATKTAGLAERLRAERNLPRADVYWGNEPFHTLRLADEGLLEPYTPPTAANIPERWRSTDNLYTPIGLRARVLAVSLAPKFAKDLAAAAPLSIESLADPRFKSRVGVCIPSTGTAAGHFAALYVLWGEEKYTAVLHAWRTNDVKVLGGNSVVAAQVGAGQLAIGLTDNDDVTAVASEGGTLTAILPNQGPAQLGTLLIPSTVALVKGAPNPAPAKRLIDFLTTPQIETELINAKFFAFSVRDTHTVTAMNVDYKRVAANLRTATELALKILQNR